MLIGTVSFFDDEGASLTRCLLSLRGVVDYIIAVDGAYKDFPHERPYSDEATLSIARELAHEVVAVESAWENEIAKRNRYLIGNPGDRYLMLDADEEFTGVLPEMVEDDYLIDIRRTDGVPPYPLYRVFRHRPGLKYVGAHNALFIDGRDEPLNLKTMETLKGCHIVHHQDRSGKRKAQKGEYYRALTRAEEVFRIKWGL